MSKSKQRRPLPRASVAKRPAKKKSKAAEVRGLEVPEGMTPAMFEFCLNYRANGFNASAAYKAAHPGVTDGTARTEGHRTLTNPHVAGWLRKHVGERWQQWEMSGDEAIARIAMDGRADIRLLYGADGKLLPIHDWPDEVAQSVRSYDATTGKITLNDSASARRVIGEHSGKLKNAAGGLGSLAEILAQKLAEDDE